MPMFMNYIHFLNYFSGLGNVASPSSSSPVQMALTFFRSGALLQDAG